MDNKLTTISFPSISTGIFAVDPKIAAKKAMEAIVQFQKDNPEYKFKEIRLINFTGPSEALRAEFNQLKSAQPKAQSTNPFDNPQNNPSISNEEKQALHAIPNPFGGEGPAVQLNAIRESRIPESLAKVQERLTKMLYKGPDDAASLKQELKNIGDYKISYNPTLNAYTLHSRSDNSGQLTTRMFRLKATNTGVEVIKLNPDNFAEVGKEKDLNAYLTNSRYNFTRLVTQPGGQAQNLGPLGQVSPKAAPPPNAPLENIPGFVPNLTVEDATKLLKDAPVGTYVIGKMINMSVIYFKDNKGKMDNIFIYPQKDGTNKAVHGVLGQVQKYGDGSVQALIQHFKTENGGNILGRPYTKLPPPIQLGDTPPSGVDNPLVGVPEGNDFNPFDGMPKEYPPNLTPTEMELKNSPQNQGIMSREEAEKLLMDKDIGTAILRFSPTQNKFVVTVKIGPEKVKHFIKEGSNLEEIKKEFPKLLPNSSVIKEFIKNILSHTNYSQRTTVFSEFGSQVLNYQTILSQIRSQTGSEKKISSEGIAKFITTAIGHEWGLSGNVDVNGVQHSFEKGYSDINHMRLAGSVEKYFAANQGNQTSPASRLNPQNLENLQACLNNAPQYMRHTRSADEAVNDYNKGLPVTLGSGWRGHSVEITLHNGYLIYTNRGETLDESSGRMPGNMMVYKINGKVTKEVIEKLLSRDNKENEAKKADQMKYIENSGPNTMVGELGLELVDVVEKKGQKVGNCSWANTKGAVYSSMTLMLMQDIKEKNVADNKQNPQIPLLTEKEVLAQASQQAKEIYKDWEVSSRHDELNSFLALENDVLAKNVALSPKDYFTAITKIGAKIALKQSYQEGGGVGNAADGMKNEVQAKLRDSRIPLNACIQTVTDTTDLTNALRNSKPGAFILYNSTTAGARPNELILSYKTANPPPNDLQHVNVTLNGDGSVEYNVNGTKKTMKTLGELMKTFSELSTPISLDTVSKASEANKPILENLEDSGLMYTDFKSIAEKLRRYKPGEVVGMYKNASGNVVLCQRLPSFVKSTSSKEESKKEFLEIECRPNEKISDIRNELLSFKGEFKTLKNLKPALAFDTEKAAREALNNPNMTMVVYKDSEGNYCALRKKAGTMDPTSEKLVRDGSMFKQLDRYDQKMSLEEMPGYSSKFTSDHQTNVEIAKTLMEKSGTGTYVLGHNGNKPIGFYKNDQGGIDMILLQSRGDKFVTTFSDDSEFVGTLQEIIDKIKTRENPDFHTPLNVEENTVNAGGATLPPTPEV